MNPNDTPKLTRSEQARINGAKSQGPTTGEGKAISSRNAIKHGFAAKQNVVIASEDATGWQAHLDGYRASFNPTCIVESDLVDHLASISWRQSRLVAIETSLIDAQLCLQVGNVFALHPNSATDDYFHTALAWQALARPPIRSAAATGASP